MTRLLDGTRIATLFEATEGIADRLLALGDLNPARQTLALVDLLLELAGYDGRILAGYDGRILAGDGPMDGLSRLARRRVDALCAYLQERFTDDIQLAEVAAVAYLSPAACSRFFRRALGRTMTQYVTELRIATACQLLRDSELPIAEIATRCGYNNLSNFNRHFRIIKGRTPGSYRRSMAQAQLHTNVARARP